MANNVYANGMEVSCKAAEGKSICAFPDVCFTPPENPATPPGVPVPYPNTAMASDATGGSKSVKISNKEVMLKNRSYFKKSSGNEAGSAAKKGVVTSTNRGKVYFASWSMNVKIEGANAVRHLDMTTHNHASQPCNSPPWPYTDEMVLAQLAAACQGEVKNLKRACRGQNTSNCSDDCKKAQKCLLPPKKDDKAWCCAPNNTGHHMIEDHWVAGMAGFPTAQGSAGYGGAPSVCVNNGRTIGEHGEMHAVQGLFEESFMSGGFNHQAGAPSGGWSYGEGKRAALHAHEATFSDANCTRECIESQLDVFYGEDPARPLKPPTTQKIGTSLRGPTLGNWGHVIRG